MKKMILPLILLTTLPARAALEKYEKTLSGGKVVFLKEKGMTPEQFGKADYRLKPDPAYLQTYFPLTTAMRQAISAEDIKTLTQEEIDQLYIRLTSGPIVPAQYEGSIVANGELAGKAFEVIRKDFRGVRVLESLCRDKAVNCLAELAWKGKRIYPRNEAGEYQLRNAISKPFALGLKAALVPLKNQFDLGNLVFRTEEEFLDEDRYMIFPAHVYCGQSLYDHRRESIIVDYAWGSDFKPFIQGLDNIMGREFLDIRDELRMIRPGLYLGRAYTNKIFLLNFVLHSKAVEKAAAANPIQVSGDACFTGKTTR